MQNLTRKNLFHKNIGIPRAFESIKNRTCYVNPSTHARKECNSDRNGHIYLPSTLKFSFADIIEIETYQESKDIKIVLRIDYSKANDLIVVALFPNADVRDESVNFAPSAFIKTAWLNSVEDNHKTLDESRYDSPIN